MDRAVLGGLGFGSIVGGALYVAFSSNWFLIAAVIAMYTGWGYFGVRYHRLLLREFPAFDRPIDRLGYAIGLFGVSIGPVAFSQQFTTGDISIELFVGYIGVVGFLLSSSVAAVDAETDSQ
ncbi:hypothetical protein [Natronorubrum sp. DTA7]|uniref:hypothetical protein n=1 Tax=Natronorubrum sp. DTA7 TaxID=3447016 RepID=UPI003F86ACF1